MKNEDVWSYSQADRDQRRFEAQIKHDRFIRKINEKPRRKKKKK